MIEAMEESGTEVYRLSDEERLLVDEGLDQANRGQFVRDEDMDKFWNRHRMRRKPNTSPNWSAHS